MVMSDAEPDLYTRRVSSIREEMKFELGVLHDRINALVSAQAFLIIAFMMSLAYSNDRFPGRFFWISPLLASVGFLLAVLAWPSVNRSYDIIVEWNVLLIEALKEARKERLFVWRPSVEVIGDVRTQDHHRRSILFTRSVPAVFAFAWLMLGVIVLSGPMQST